jgi:hypothetical protein
MSWIFGFSGYLSEQKKLSLSSLHPEPLIKVDEPRLFIAAGGTAFTCNFSVEKKWIVLGVGIETDASGSRFTLKNEWDQKISKNNFREPQGHYIIIKWDSEKINFYSDFIGLRTIYFFKDKTGIYFSSNLEWITSVMAKVEIDFKEFGSRWMTFNQFSNKSFIYDAERLPPASAAEIKSDVLKIQTENWLPEINESDPGSLFGIIEKFLSVEIPDTLKLSFGLSGGLDSRFLLSFLLRDRNKKINIHSFGYNDDPDLQVAKRISDELVLKCSFVRPPAMDSGQFLNKAADYAAAVQMIEPVTSYMKLSVMENRYFENKFLIDGALAEFARRQFLNRLLIKGKNALLDKKYAEVIKHLMVPKPGIFKDDIEEIMYDSSVEQIKKIYESFPDPREIGPENFADLLVVKFRIPNYFGPEQNRLDNILPGFTVFAQRSTISASLGIPVQQRKNSQLFYDAIHKNYPALEEFPLVKDANIYPYGMTSLTAYAYTGLKRKFGRSSWEATLFNFFKTHEKAIKEIITREEVREYKPYDEESVMRIINDFYSGRTKDTSDLNWLLTFEMFRKKLDIIAS